MKEDKMNMFLSVAKDVRKTLNGFVYVVAEYRDTSGLKRIAVLLLDRDVIEKLKEMLQERNE
jgi:hypothetical protein